MNVQNVKLLVACVEWPTAHLLEVKFFIFLEQTEKNVVKVNVLQIGMTFPQKQFW